ncbi:MAG: Gfo/Idh/MocA family protein [Phycisphaeraceae bacterium]
MKQVRVGVVGCGNISSQYFRFARQFPILDIAACADLDPARAKAQAAEFGVPRAGGVADLLADESIEIILNLTIPAAHVEVGLAALDAGKHVYSEKPLAASVAEGRKLLEAAEAKSLRVGCAPDTFLGTAQQTCRKLIDEGAIGRPLAATAFMLCPGHESWHPDPAFYYQPGGGPMFDMGPYYLTALINLLGPARRVTGLTGVLNREREVGSGPKAGEKIEVNTADHVAGHLEFESGAIATLVTSFATRFATYDGAHPIAIYGSEGTLQVPDPNRFDGTVRLRRVCDADWQEVKAEHTHPNGRSLGLADLAHAVQAARPHRASAELAFAVLGAMEGFQRSSDEGRHVALEMEHARPAMLPVGLEDGVIEG